MSNREKHFIFDLMKHVMENFKLKLNILYATTKCSKTDFFLSF